MRTLGLILAFGVGILYFQFPYVIGKSKGIPDFFGLLDGCCPSVFGKCGDGSSATPCCGQQPCNFWCCNCGQCHGRRKRDVTSGVPEPTGFEKMDQNGDGHVDKEEAHSHLLTGACGNYTEKIVDFHDNFNKFDKDGDGKLSYAEVNAAG